ncbi:MAG: hypothetical protein AB9866_08835 [Syntrophobacteraceae bacterium]
METVKPETPPHAGAMTTKEQVIKLVKAMPDDATLDDVLERLYFKLQVDQGLAELDRGESISHDEVERRLAKWLSP